MHERGQHSHLQMLSMWKAFNDCSTCRRSQNIPGEVEFRNVVTVSKQRGYKCTALVLQAALPNTQRSELHKVLQRPTQYCGPLVADGSV